MSEGLLPHQKFAYECLRIGRLLEDAGELYDRDDMREKAFEIKKAAVFLLGFPDKCPYADDSLNEQKKEEADSEEEEEQNKAPWPLTWFFK